MKNTMLIILYFVISFSFAQTEKAENSIVTQKVVKEYNEGNYDAIFSMFSDTMKDALPEEKNAAFLKNLKSQAGNISDIKFLKYVKGTYASYKTTCEHALLSLNISIDDNSKINGLFVQPFTEKAETENPANIQNNEDDSITQIQSEIIFKNVKSFPVGTQVSIAIIKNGDVCYYGLENTNDTIKEVNNQTNVFEIGSISKVFTSTLLANLVVKGKLRLNENINEYLNTPFKDNIKISFEDLASHTSGLDRLPSNLDLSNVDPQNPYKQYGEKEIQDYLSKYLELKNAGQYRYSNLGAGLLGYTLSKIANDSYENLLQAMIFSKYNMQDSTADINKVDTNLVKGLNNEGEVVSNWEFSALAGAGAIFSNVQDLSKIVLAQFNGSNKELVLTREKTHNVNQNMDIGLGWHILTSKSANAWFWHNGGTGGYTSSMVFDVISENGIIILSNVSAFNPNKNLIDQLCFELMQTLN